MLQPATRLSYIYVPVKVQDAWRFLMGVSDDEVSLDGIAQLEGVGARQLQHLPDDLQRLTFHPKFNQRFSAHMFNTPQLNFMSLLPLWTSRDPACNPPKFR